MKALNPIKNPALYILLFWFACQVWAVLEYKSNAMYYAVRDCNEYTILDKGFYTNACDEEGE